MSLYADQPCLQVYTANTLRTTAIGHGGRLYLPGDGIALEPQQLPDAPNQRWMPDPTLHPGEEYRSRTSWRFREV